jgi:DNA-binding transcriptional MocR family regulator
MQRAARERTLDAIMSDGHLPTHTNQLREKLRRATEAAKKALTELDAQISKEGDRRMYLWAARPEWPDTMKLTKALLERGVILAPGAVFSPVPDQVSPYCRFKLAYLADERFIGALRAVAA